MICTFFRASCLAQQHQHGNSENGNGALCTSMKRGGTEGVDRAVTLLHSFHFKPAIEGFDARWGTEGPAESRTGDRAERLE